MPKRRGALNACLVIAALAMVGCGGARTLGVRKDSIRTSTGPTRAPHSLTRAGCTRRKTVCRILFIGNSYTYINDMPAIVMALARVAHKRVVAKVLAEPNATLGSELSSAETAIVSRQAEWNVVVLQEQSEIPAVAQLREERMYPTVRKLVRSIRDVHAQPMLYLTPARRPGWPEQSLSNYGSMQTAVNEGYLDIARELGAAVAPVGFAWSVARRKYPLLALWLADGSHPSTQGSYLAACVFYAAIFRKTPEKLAYYFSLPGRVVSKLQTIAADVTLAHQAEWGLTP